MADPAMPGGGGAMYNIKPLDSLGSLLAYVCYQELCVLAFFFSFSTPPIMASRILIDAAGQKKTPCEITPAEVYYGSSKVTTAPIKLRIATGGAGQSHLIKALADAFIDYSTTKNVNKSQPFAVAWIKSDTTASFNHIADNTADLSITYHEKAEEIAIKQGIADGDVYVYAWRDHFMFVGM